MKKVYVIQKRILISIRKTEKDTYKLDAKWKHDLFVQ